MRLSRFSALPNSGEFVDHTTFYPYRQIL